MQGNPWLVDYHRVRKLVACLLAVHHLHHRGPPQVDLNISAITLRAAPSLSERGDMGEAGCGDRSAAIKSRVAAMAKSVDRKIGVRLLVVNHTTVLEMRPPHVSAMYT